MAISWTAKSRRSLHSAIRNPHFLPALVPDGATILAAFGSTIVDTGYRVAHDRLIPAVAAQVESHLMSSVHQFADVVVRETAFDFDLPAVSHYLSGRLRRSFMMPARRIACFLQIHPEVDQIGEDLDVPLRLHVAAHHPKASQGLPFFITNPGMRVWNGRLPGAYTFG